MPFYVSQTIIVIFHKCEKGIRILSLTWSVPNVKIEARLVIKSWPLNRLKQINWRICFINEYEHQFRITQNFSWSSTRLSFRNSCAVCIHHLAENSPPLLCTSPKAAKIFPELKHTEKHEKQFSDSYLTSWDISSSLISTRFLRSSSSSSSLFRIHQNQGNTFNSSSSEQPPHFTWFG